MFNSDTFNRDAITSASSVLFITGKFNLRPGIRLILEVPVSHVGFTEDEFFEGSSHTTIGNLYAGGQLDIPSSSLNLQSNVELGLRFASMPEPGFFEDMGYFTGALSENERKEAFIYKMWSVPVALNSAFRLNERFSLETKLGTNLDIYAGEESEALDNELHLIYGATGLYSFNSFTAHLGLNGRNHYAGNEPEFADTGLLQARGGISFSAGSLEPGMFVRAPLGENYSEIVDWAFGFSIAVGF